MRKINLLTAVALFASFAFGQAEPNSSNVGLPANGVFDGTDFDTVQLNNGNLHINIPVFSFPGRGMGYAEHYIYDNKGWSLKTVCDNHMGVCTDYIVEPVRSVLTLILPTTVTIKRGRTTQKCTPPGVTMPILQGLKLNDRNGSSHHFVPDPMNTADQTFGVCSTWAPYQSKLYADDGSGWIYDVVRGAVISSDGKKYGGSTGGITDNNGNQVNGYDTLGHSYTDP